MAINFNKKIKDSKDSDTKTTLEYIEVDGIPMKVPVTTSNQDEKETPKKKEHKLPFFGKKATKSAAVETPADEQPAPDEKDAEKKKNEEKPKDEESAPVAEKKSIGEFFKKKELTEEELEEKKKREDFERIRKDLKKSHRQYQKMALANNRRRDADILADGTLSGELRAIGARIDAGIKDASVTISTMNSGKKTDKILKDLLVFKEEKEQEDAASDEVEDSGDKKEETKSEDTAGNPAVITPVDVTDTAASEMPGVKPGTEPKTVKNMADGDTVMVLADDPDFA